MEGGQPLGPGLGECLHFLSPVVFINRSFCVSSPSLCELRMGRQSSQSGTAPQPLSLSHHSFKLPWPRPGTLPSSLPQRARLRKRYVTQCYPTACLMRLTLPLASLQAQSPLAKSRHRLPPRLPLSLDPGSNKAAPSDILVDCVRWWVVFVGSWSVHAGSRLLHRAHFQ